MKTRQIQLFHIYYESWCYSLNCPIIIFFFLKFKELQVSITIIENLFFL